MNVRNSKDGFQRCKSFGDTRADLTMERNRPRAQTGNWMKTGMGTRAAPRKFRFLCLAAALMLLMNGCSRDPVPGRNTECRPTHFEVLQTIADDAEIRRYAAAHFESRETTFLWDRMPAKAQACGTLKSGIKLVRSSSPSFDRTTDFIAIYKMYYDEDAAFVEIGFPPTGKNGDVFLRKRAGKWVVVEKSLWES